ncbi:MAG: T9SS type A sorting domain-containing protein, partial [Bacteroidales bacterium]|nr:T9SS type A sorting domain-containing protein [Bacteroidales bacterium]
FPECYSLPCYSADYCSEYFSKNDRLFAMAQPYHTDTSILLDGIIIHNSYDHYNWDTTYPYPVYTCDSLSLYCEILDKKRNVLYHIRYDTINRYAPSNLDGGGYTKHCMPGIPFYELNFDRLVEVSDDFYVTLTLGDNYTTASLYQLMAFPLPCGDLDCDSIINYTPPLLQFKNDTTWYNANDEIIPTKYRSIFDVPVFPRINTNGIIPAASSSLNEVKAEEIAVNIFPNPANENIEISCGYTIKKISIFDEQGKLLENKEVNNLSFQLDLKNYPNGTYVAIVQTSKGQTTKKFIKQ